MNRSVFYYFANVIRISNSDSTKYCFRKRNPVQRDMFPGDLHKGLLSLGDEGSFASFWNCWRFKWRVARSECFSRSHYVTIRIRGQSKLPVLKGWRVSPSCEHVPFVRAYQVRKRYWFSRFRIIWKNSITAILFCYDASSVEANWISDTKIL